MRLVNEMTAEERDWHEQDKRRCRACFRQGRTLLDRRTSIVTWTSHAPQWFPPRRFINARIRVTEETWACAECPKAKEVGGAVVGLVLDFEHVGDPGEIVAVDPPPGS